jgi:hypothetical protein
VPGVILCAMQTKAISPVTGVHVLNTYDPDRCGKASARLVMRSPILINFVMRFMDPG